MIFGTKIAMNIAIVSTILLRNSNKNDELQPGFCWAFLFSFVKKEHHDVCQNACNQIKYHL